ncbi:MAG: transglutaminase-like domain-containing protein, partial [Planctomycetota bacterium]
AAMAFTVTAVGLFQAGRTGAVGGVRSSRLLPTVVIVLCGVVAAGLTLTAAAALRNYTRSIDRLVADLLFELQRGNGRVGFSRDPGRLGSTRDLKVEPGSTAAAVRVAGLKPPVYLRGSAFVVFTESSTGAFAWDEAMIAAEKSGNRDVSLRIPVDGVPDNDPGMFRYRAERVGTTSRDRVADGDPTETRRVDVRLIDPGLWEDYFMPAGSVGLTSPAPKIVAGPGSVRSGGEPAEEYRLDVLADGDADRPAYIEPDFSAMADDEAAAIVWGVGLTSVPTALAGDERFEALVAEVFDGCDTVTEHVAAVQTYFVRNYRYDLQVTVPSGRNALEYFLFDRPDAYCEYFATAAAVLLRARGIPTRYVTGFVAAEKNGAGGFLTARNEDAHAWAEAYDPERGWILVEATADSGIPRTRAAPPVVAFWDTANDALLRFRAGFRRGGWYWLFLATLRSAGTPAGLIVIALAATYLGVRSYQVWGGRRRLAIDPLVGRLENLRRRADRLSARAGRLRATSEPPLRFARRLRDEFADPAWADWYAAYADVRYDPSRDRAAVERVARGLEGLGKVPTRRPKS